MPQSRKKKKYTYGVFTGEDNIQEMCAYGACLEEGEYRARTHALEDNKYIYLCKEHIIEHNKSWDFFRNMSQDEIELYHEQAYLWNRPTQPLDKQSVGQTFNFSFEQFYTPWKAHYTYYEKNEGVIDKNPETIQEALLVLDLTMPFKYETVRAKYFSLAKQYHPDLHKGSKNLENKLKIINAAYKIVKNFLRTQE